MDNKRKTWDDVDNKEKALKLIDEATERVLNSVNEELTFKHPYKGISIGSKTKAVIRAIMKEVTHERH